MRVAIVGRGDEDLGSRLDDSPEFRVNLFERGDRSRREGRFHPHENSGDSPVTADRSALTVETVEEKDVSRGPLQYRFCLKLCLAVRAREGELGEHLSRELPNTRVGEKPCRVAIAPIDTQRVVADFLDRFRLNVGRDRVDVERGLSGVLVNADGALAARAERPVVDA